MDLMNGTPSWMSTLKNGHHLPSTLGLTVEINTLEIQTYTEENIDTVEALVDDGLQQAFVCCVDSG